MSFLIANWKYIAILCLTLALAFTYNHIKKLNADIKLLSQNLVSCQEINKECENVVRLIQEGAKKASEACDKRINEKIKLISQLSQIDGMQEPINEKERCKSATDPLYNQFMRMFDKPTNR